VWQSHPVVPFWERRLLTVNSCIKVRLDLQADKSPVVVKGQDHHRDPSLILLLAPGTPTWSSVQGSHVG
jgi:hypothetical protein